MSFKDCAPNLAMDRKDDMCIHCFKKDQPFKVEKEILEKPLSILTQEDMYTRLKLIKAILR